MNVMSTVQVYCPGVCLFGKCPLMLNPPGGYLLAVRYEHQNRARNGSCCINLLCIFQYGFRLVLVTGIHCVSSSQKLQMFDFIFAQLTLIERVPEVYALSYVTATGGYDYTFESCHRKWQKPHKGAFAILVRVTGFEPAASWSQTTRATSCATPGNRQNKLAALRFRLKAKTAHPLLPSSSPKRTSCAGLRFGKREGRSLFRSSRKAHLLYIISGRGARRICAGEDFLRKAKKRGFFSD